MEDIGDQIALTIEQHNVSTNNDMRIAWRREQSPFEILWARLDLFS
jgi:hypothetical protein